MRKLSTLRSYSAKASALLAVACGLFSTNAQAVTIFAENMGTVGGTTAIATHDAASGFQNSVAYDFTGLGDLRNTTVSAGYAGASGSANVFLTTNAVPRTFQIAGIVTTGYTNLSLSFGAFKSTTTSNMTELVVEYSTDGTTWNALTFPAQAVGGGTANWRLVTITGGTIPATGNLRLRWSGATATTQFRLDDVTLTGDLAGTNTSVAFAAASSNAGEATGTTDLTINVSDPDAVNATNVTITATGATGRISTFTSPVVVTAPGTSGTCTVSLADNLICDGDENVTFTITGVSGGQGTPTIGAQATHVLTVNNNDICTSVQFLSATASGSEGRRHSGPHPGHHQPRRHESPPRWMWP